MSRVSPNTNAITRPHKIGMRIEAGVHQSKGHAPAGESGVRVKSKACGQNSECGFRIEWPCRLNRFMEGRVSLRKQRPQQILLDACWTPTIVTIPERIPSGFGELSFADRIPAHRALSECARWHIAHPSSGEMPVARDSFVRDATSVVKPIAYAGLLFDMRRRVITLGLLMALSLAGTNPRRHPLGTVSAGRTRPILSVLRGSGWIGIPGAWRLSTARKSWTARFFWMSARFGVHGAASWTGTPTQILRLRTT